jgi:hypothetical protein
MAVAVWECWKYQAPSERKIADNGCSTTCMMAFDLGPVFLTVGRAVAVSMKSPFPFGAERQSGGSLIIFAASDYAS